MEIIKKTLEGLEYCIHTTYSHTAEKPKLRVVVPFSQPVPPKQLKAIFDDFNRRFGGKLDSCGAKPAQLYYQPSCPKDAPFESFRGHGELFDPTSLIKPASNQTELPVSKEKLDYNPGDRNIPNIPLPKACRDGERHAVFLPAVGRGINQSHNYDEILQWARQWNETNHGRWPDETLVSKVNGMFTTDCRNHPERYTKKPWGGINPPAGFMLNHKGVLWIPEKDDKPPLRVSGPVWISARTRDTESTNWGHLVEWIDGDHKPHRMAVPSQRLHDPRSSLAQDLAGEGLDIVPGFERKLITYLGRFNPDSRICSVTRLGWLDERNGRLVYVLPNAVHGNNNSEEYVFQPERYNPTASTMGCRGTLESWQKEVAALASGNPTLIFSLSLAFAPALLKASAMDGGGFHLYGRSSHGKTTAAQLAGSVGVRCRPCRSSAAGIC